MARSRSLKVELKSYSNSSRPGDKWIVYWPSDVPGGNRRSKRFKVKKDAAAFAEQKQIDVANKGAEGGGVHANALDEAKWAIKALAPYGVSIRQAVDAFIERQDQVSRSVTVRYAVTEFIEAKKRAGGSERYLRDIRCRFGRFEEAFADRMVCDIAVRELSVWIHQLGLGPTSQNNYRRNLGVFFNWAKRLGYCRENPAKLVERARRKAEPVGIFTSDELRVILSNAPDELVPALAIGAFAGLRVSEIGRLDWSELNFAKNHIEVAAEKSKTASRRFVPMETVLREWLEPLKRVKGPVAPDRINEELSAYRRVLEVEDRSGNGVVIRPAVEWRPNGLRHSYGSYAIAREENADRVALWMGHTSASMTFQCYQERATKEEAAAWFGVGRKSGEARRKGVRAS